MSPLPPPSKPRLFLALFGLIGAGKSTLTKRLSEELNLPPYYEDVEGDIYLKEFYKDMKKEAFSFQIHLLARRSKDQFAITWGDGGIMDRSLYEDRIFIDVLKEMGYIADKEVETYDQLFETLKKVMRQPDALIYLKITPQESYNRIQMRGREEEKGITLKYLEDLYEKYELHIKELSKAIPVIQLDWSQFQEDRKVVADTIIKELGKIQTIHKVSFKQEE